MGADFYPTPLWATRALIEQTPNLSKVVWEPACGDGRIVAPLEQAGHRVVKSDLYDYGLPGAIRKDFLTSPAPTRPCAVVTNPPNRLSKDFCVHALGFETTPGMQLHLLMPVQALTGHDRYREVYSHRPPDRVLLFTDRVVMFPASWCVSDSEAKGGTAEYAWFSWWEDPAQRPPSPFAWVPPNTRKRLQHVEDDRYALAYWAIHGTGGAIPENGGGDAARAPEGSGRAGD